MATEAAQAKRYAALMREAQAMKGRNDMLEAANDDLRAAVHRLTCEIGALTQERDALRQYAIGLFQSLTMGTPLPGNGHRVVGIGKRNGERAEAEAEAEA